MPMRTFIGPPRLRPHWPIRPLRCPGRGAPPLARLHSWSLLLLIAFVLLARTPGFHALRDFGHRNIPPPSALGRCFVGIGFDRDDVGAVGGACARERGFELRNRL